MKIISNVSIYHSCRLHIQWYILFELNSEISSRHSSPILSADFKENVSGRQFIGAVDTTRACEIKRNCSGFMTFGTVLILATCCTT